MREIRNLELLDHQFDALEIQGPHDRYVDVVGGIGSGKSFLGACHVLQMVKMNPFTPGFIGANSVKQLNDATLNTTFQLLDSLKIPFTYKQQKGHLWVGTKMFFCRTMDNYEDFRGFEISDFWVDEKAYAKHQAMKVLRGRMRHPAAKFFRGLGTTSPAGFNWFYDEAVVTPIKNSRLVRARTKDNFHLPDSYEEDLRGSYDARMIQQELDGDFVNLNALPTYYAWDRNKLIDSSLDYNADLPIYIGMDFNVNPMTAVIFQVTANEILFIDEVYLDDGKHSNTYGMADKLIEMGFHGCTIVPDATGKALKTSAEHGKSDHVILKDKGFVVASATSNPHVADRYLCMNGLMKWARLRVHPRCVKLIRDFEQHSRNGEHEDFISHISDAAGYGAWKFFPVRKERPQMKQYAY
jgi:hypothetical protein